MSFNNLEFFLQILYPKIINDQQYWIENKQNELQIWYIWLTIDMDLELLSSIVWHSIEGLAYVGAHVDSETELRNSLIGDYPSYFSRSPKTCKNLSKQSAQLFFRDTCAKRM